MATERASEVDIPQTLHGLLLGRIDRLPAEARQVLRVASVIGRSFTLGVLERVVATDAAEVGLGPRLALLEGAGLVTVASAAPELEYAFRHALINDAAYESVLRQERQRLHADVAEALLQLYPERSEELAPVLAHHFERAGDHERALEQLIVAARGARARFARHEAVDFAKRALALLPQGEEIDDEQRRLRGELRQLWSEAGVDFEPLANTLEALSLAVADADALGDTTMAARANLLAVKARSLGGEQYRSSPELASTLERARALAERSGSPELVAMALLATAETRYASSEFGPAIELFERAIPALVETEQLLDASVAAGFLGTAYGHVGEFEPAIEWTDRAYQLGVDSGDPNASLDADLARSIVESIRGDTDAAIEYAGKAAEAAGRVDNKACAMVAHSVIGEQHLRTGDAAQATIAFEASADLAAFCQFMPVKVEQTELLLQTARAGAGTAQLDLRRYDKALELARQFGDRLAEAQLYEQRARDRSRTGQDELVEGDLERAQALFEDIGGSAHVRRVQELRQGLSSPSSARLTS